MEVLSRPVERGLTLVEALVALLILALVAVSILGMFTHGIQLNASGADYMTLTNLAKDRAETLLGLPFGHPDLAAGTYSAPTANGGLLVTYAVQNYSINQNFPNLPEAIANGTVAEADANTKLITVTVASQRLFMLGSRNATIQRVKTP